MGLPITSIIMLLFSLIGAYKAETVTGVLEYAILIAISAIILAISYIRFLKQTKF